MQVIFYIIIGILILAGYLVLAFLFCTIGVIYGFGIAIFNYSKSFLDNVKIEN